jgi:hypothetical protein
MADEMTKTRAARLESRRTGPYWYMTSRVILPQLVGNEWLVWPATTVHAKQHGTMTTACGVWADGWHKLMDMPFPTLGEPVPSADICRACSRAIAGAGS